MTHSFNPQINETIAAQSKWKLEKDQRCAIDEVDYIYVVDCVTDHIRLVAFQPGDLDAKTIPPFAIEEIVGAIIHMVKKDSKSKLNAKQVNELGNALAIYAIQTQNYQLWKERKISPKLHMVVNIYREKHSKQGKLRPGVFVPKGKMATSDEIQTMSGKLLEHDMINNPSFLKKT
jgi:hypothetical protein